MSFRSLTFLVNILYANLKMSSQGIHNNFNNKNKVTHVIPELAFIDE